MILFVPAGIEVALYQHARCSTKTEVEALRDEFASMEDDDSEEERRRSLAANMFC